MIRWLIFLVNFLFALGGLVLLGFGLFLHFNLYNTEELPEIGDAVTVPTILLIIIGGIVFVIALFGCCGAVQESHCCVVTFALMLLTLLVVQIAVASYGYWKLKDQDLERKINEQLYKLVHNYNDGKDSTKTTVDVLQIFGDCCGFEGPQDYAQQQIPYSCCGKPERQYCMPDEAIRQGCKNRVYERLETYGKGLGLGALIIAAVELVGVVFAFCLANSIRNAERREYKV